MSIQLNLPQQAVSLPGLITNTPFLTVIAGYSNSGYTASDNMVDFSYDMAISLARPIIEKELSIMYKKAHEVDPQRLQQFINSPDKEMNELAYVILREHTKYTELLIKHIKNKDTYQIQWTVRRYYEKNALNMTDEVII